MSHFRLPAFFHKVEECVKSACLTTHKKLLRPTRWDFIRWERMSPWTWLPCGPVWLRQRKWLCIKGRGLAFCGTLSPVTQGHYGKRLHWCCLLNTSTDVHCRNKHPVTTDLCRTAGGRAALEVEASVLLFIQRIGVLQLQGFSWATATFRGKSSC